MIPFHIETLYRHQPSANWGVLGATALVGVAVMTGLLLPGETTAAFALGEGGRWTLLTHIFAHEHIASLVADLLFLWVTGNAICGLLGNIAFLLLYAAIGIVSGLVQLAITGHPVLGAGGAVAGMIGICIAFFPTNTLGLYFPGPSSLRAIPAPLWTLLLYWGTWSAAGAVLHLDSTAIWGQLTGLLSGIVLGTVIVTTGWVEFTDCDNGPLFMINQQQSTDSENDDGAAAAREELRRLARLYYEEYAAMPEIQVGIPAAKRRRLTLKRSMDFARTAAEPARHAAASAESAWPVDLPDVRFFHFDGVTRHGPESRAEFLQCLSLAADTSAWWYWAEGMEDWASVDELNRARMEMLHQLQRAS